MEVGRLFEGGGPGGELLHVAALDAVEVGPPDGAGGRGAVEAEVGEGDREFGDPAEVGVVAAVEGAGDAGGGAQAGGIPVAVHEHRTAIALGAEDAGIEDGVEGADL